jgi:hypothetical protein
MLSVPATLYAVLSHRPVSRCAMRLTDCCSSSCKALSEQFSTFCACVLRVTVLSWSQVLHQREYSDPRDFCSSNNRFGVCTYKCIRDPTFRWKIDSLLFLYIDVYCSISELRTRSLLRCHENCACALHIRCAVIVWSVPCMTCCNLNVLACTVPYFHMQFQFSSPMKYTDDKLLIIHFGRKIAFGFYQILLPVRFQFSLKGYPGVSNI